MTKAEALEHIDAIRHEFVYPIVSQGLAPNKDLELAQKVDKHLAEAGLLIMRAEFDKNEYLVVRPDKLKG